MSLSAKQARVSRQSLVIPIAAPRRERLRFADFTFALSPSGHCSARVSLEWGGEAFSGMSTGQSSPLGDLRIAALATLRALEDFTKEAMRFELIGIKHLRAFDANLLIVSILLRDEAGETRLAGCYLADDDTRRASAMAVLNATNRILGNHIAAL